jgi:hypothetical protein
MNLAIVHLRDLSAAFVDEGRRRGRGNAGMFMVTHVLEQEETFHAKWFRR